MKYYSVNDDLKLFNNYTNAYRENESKRYTDFSEFSPFSVDSICESITNGCNAYSGDRNALCTILHDYNSIISADIKVFENIALLKDENTFAIITGHQPALFGGPLFIFLKIASVISAVEQLNKKHNKYKFVPVFWNASEDHNIAEFGSISYYDSANDIKNISINLEQGKKMSSHLSGELLDTVISDVMSSLPFTEFTETIHKEISSALSENLGLSFSGLISSWFKKYGLILIEPEYLRELAAPVMISAIKNHQQMIDNMRVDSEEMLNEGFTPQLPFGDQSNSFLFYIEKGKRHRIKYENEKFTVNESSWELNSEELITRIKATPQLFSPVAALRPIIQSSLFPTAGYVAGGGELAYHYQLRRNFKLLKQHLPVIIPRISGTFITPSIKKMLEKFSLPIENIFKEIPEWENIQNKLLANSNELNKAFNNYKINSAELNDVFSQHLADIGITNQNEFKREIDKFASRIEMLQKRFAAEAIPGGKNAKKRFFKLRKFLFPADKYQELSICGLYFYSLLGKEFFTTICDVNVFLPQHSVWIFD